MAPCSAVLRFASRRLSSYRSRCLRTRSAVPTIEGFAVVACDVVVVDRNRPISLPSPGGVPTQKAFPTAPVERLWIVRFRIDIPLEGDISHFSPCVVIVLLPSERRVINDDVVDVISAERISRIPCRSYRSGTFPATAMPDITDNDIVRGSGSKFHDRGTGCRRRARFVRQW